VNLPERLSFACVLRTVLGVCLPWLLLAPAGASDLVGVGMSDVTGEAADVGMFGYAQVTQQTTGIHQRLRARAFLVEDQSSHDAIVIVVSDLGAIMQSVHQAVMQRLATLYGGRYGERNVMLTATHTHSGPGGYSHDLLYNLTVMGFHPATFNAIVDGIVEAVQRAHDSRAPGSVRWAQGELLNASRNRSAAAFRANAAADRAAFPMEIDPEMSVMTLRQGERDVGAISWFPSHATCMTSQNTLISGDHKGYAAWHWEHEVHGVRYLQRPAAPAFVAAFAQTAAGDMSPNLNLRPGSGPTEDQFKNTRLIGLRQFEKAQALSTLPGQTLIPGVGHRMRYIDMSGIAVQPRYSGSPEVQHTCPAALGTTFAAGSVEDGPGPAFIHEGQPNPFVAAVGRVVFPASDALRRCQAPKEVFMTLGTRQPPWTPEVLPVQLLRIGTVYIAGLPGEPTIMSGHRIRRQLAQTLGVNLHKVIVAGYANAYAGYITTPEEYDVQDYEGGSTHFGRWTQPAWMQELDRLAQDMAAARPTVYTLRPRSLAGQQHQFYAGVLADSPVGVHGFGEVIEQALPSYRPGQTVRVSFSTGHPQNNLHRQGTFLEVQRREGASWVLVADDGDRATIYRWRRQGLTASLATIEWTIPLGTPPGEYRIVHHGDARNWSGHITPFDGQSLSFLIP
jgi:neutral ceramidase